MDALSKTNGLGAPKHENKKLANPPYLVGVAGGSGCGKTTLCNKLREVIENKSLLIISLDSFYKPNITDPSQAENYNFDAPEALDFDAAFDALQALIRGEDASIPIYNFKTHQREKTTQKVASAEIILFEGIFAIYDRRIRDLMNLKLFVLVDDDERLSRRILRDIKERGRTIDSVLIQYHRFVKKSFEEFVHPTWKFADIVVPRGTSNIIAINFIVQKLRRQLSEYNHSKRHIKSETYFGQEIFEDTVNAKHPELNSNVFLLNDKKYQREFSKLLLLFNKSFSLDLYNMVIKRCAKAGLRLLRQKEALNLFNYGCFTYPIPSAESSPYYENAVIFVVFFGEKECMDVSKSIEGYWQKTPNIKISIVTIFSNLEYLNLLAENHKGKNLKICNIFCITDLDGLKYCLEKNCQNDTVKLTQESHYSSIIKQATLKYQLKHFQHDDSNDVDSATLEEESKE